jgi:transcriptional regulator with XRE-family HTH domain
MNDQMSDEDFIELLKSSLRSEKDLQVPEGADSLSTVVECSPEEIESMHAGFVKKVFGELHREPIRHIEEKRPFGRWLETARERARLIREDIAMALSKDASFVQRLEEGETPPWELSFVDAADIVCLFRIHIEAVRYLVLISLAVSDARQQVEKIAARAEGELQSKERTENLKKALDLAHAHRAGQAKPNEEINKWLKELREELQRRQATDLLE